MSKAQSQQTEQLITRIRQLSHEKRTLLFKNLNKNNVKISRLPIIKSLESSGLPLSYAQQRLWFLWQLEPGSDLYNIFSSVRISGAINVELLNESFRYLVSRHEILRTTFHADENGLPIQNINDEFYFSIQEIDLRGLDERQSQARIEVEKNVIFDLTRLPLICVKLLRVDEQEYILLLAQHHIISDGWSMQLMINELLLAYHSFSQQKIPELPPLPIHYKDFSAWQRQIMEAGEAERQLEYWLNQLEDEGQVLNLPYDRSRPAQPTYQGNQIDFQLSDSLISGLKAVAKQQTCSLFMLLLATFNVLLHRYSGQNDIRVGIPSAGRNRTEVEKLLGCFVNTQVLRTIINPDASFSDFIQGVKKMVLEAQAHQDLPFEQLVDALQPDRSLSQSPLFQVMFNYQVNNDNKTPRFALGNITVERIPFYLKTAKFDLTIDVLEEDEHLGVVLNYATDLFDPSTIERIKTHWLNILESVVAGHKKSIADIKLLTTVEYSQIIHDWNATDVHYGESQCIHSLIETQAKNAGDTIAVTGPSLQSASSSDIEQQISLSYSDLNTKANQLAHYLRAQGVGPDVLVGISVERSVEMVIGLLAILKAGGAYVPLDPEYPSERIAYMIENSNINLLLTQSSLQHQLPIPPQVETVLLDELLSTSNQSLWKNYPTINPANLTLPSNLAYVIYTSGSTGKPKGVAIAHRNTFELIRWSQSVYKCDDLQGVLAATSICFDLSVWELFVTLGSGGHVIVAENALALASHPARNQVRLVNTVPSAIAALAQANAIPASVKIVNLAGEALSQAVVDQLYGLGIDTVYDLYGPSEDTTYSTYTRRIAGGRPDIGRPISNTHTYILDNSLQPVPVGVVGELYIAGAGLAQGYLNKPQLTADKFLPNPFSTTGERFYRTGDLARYRADGVIEYAGRIDHQVKIRGFRIELGEIDAQLHALEVVRDVAVIALDTANGKQLVAYLVPQDASLAVTDNTEARQQWRADIKTALQSVLPDYMLPAHIVLLEQLPLTPNGKLDRKALPAVDASDAQQAYVAPQTELEQQLAAIWQSVLGIEQVGLNDNFFALGGDSIIALQLVSRARQAGIQFNPKDVFQHQTLQALSQVSREVDNDRVHVDQGPVTGTYPLTPIQSLFFERAIPERHHWNQAVLLQPREPLDAGLLQQAIQQLLVHHDALRLRFKASEAGQWQGEFAPVDEALETDVFWQRRVADEAALTAESTRAQASLDLSKGPLLRVVLFQVDTGQSANSEQRLLIAVHHLAIDGVSWRILLEDLQQAYRQLQQGNAIQLPPKTNSFKAWAEQLQGYASTTALHTELAYWQQLVDVNTALPQDNPEGELSNKQARHVSTRLDKALTQRLLKDAPTAYRTQVNDLLLTALARVMCRWSGEASTLIALEGHGREDLFEGVDISRTVGWFTSLFPVKLTLVSNNDIGEAIKAVKEQLRAVPNKGLGYGLLRYLGDEQTRALCEALPEARITFNYLGQFDGSFGGDEKAFVVPAKESSGAVQSEHAPLENWLSINGQVYNGTLELNWTFSGEMYRADTIQQLADALGEELKAIIAHCAVDQPLGVTPSDFPLLSISQSQLDQLPLALDQVEDIYPLSPMQQGMLFHSLNSPDDGAYLNQMQMQVQGLEVERFRAAWQATLDAHASLRAGFLWEGVDEPVQVIYRQATLPFQVHDASALTATELTGTLASLAQQRRTSGFDFAAAPLLSLDVIRLPDANGQHTHHLIFTNHHILLDGWSTSQLLGEILQRYAGEVPAQPVGSYRDYLAWLQDRNRTASETFWKGQLASLDEPTLLGNAIGRPAVDEGRERQGECQALWPVADTRDLTGFAKANKVTVNTVLQAAWLLLLQRYTGQEVVAFGATVAGRSAEINGIEQQLGLFINTLPVIAQPTATQTVGDWLQQVQQQNLQLRDYEHTPLYEIQRWAGQGGTALFDSILVFENYPVSEALQEAPGGLLFSGLHNHEQTHYGLTLVVALGEQLSITFRYDRTQFADAGIRALAEHWQSLLAGFMTNAHQALGNLPLLNTQEQQQIAKEWNATEVNYGESQCIHSLIEAQADVSATAIAVTGPSLTQEASENTQQVSLSYSDLNTKANQLAHYLRTNGVGPDVLVGIAVERSVEMVIGLLAILKAGGAYVPLDPEYPSERIAYMMENSGIGLLLTQSSLQNQLPIPAAVQTVLLDEVLSDSAQSVWKNYPATNLPTLTLPANLAYVIYTSGSTGKPKGVAVRHQGVASFLNSMATQPGITAQDRILGLTSLSFDIAGLEIYLPLSRGAQLVLLPGALAKDPDALLRRAREHQVNIIQATPSTWKMLVEADSGNYLASCKVLTGGEALPDTLANELLARTDAVWNLYGPTETTIWSAVYCLTREKDKPYVGCPIDNTQIYILDNEGNTQIPGVIGELLIGGIGLARGYFNRPGLTAERFIPDAFATEPGARLYRTGDLARYRADGVIEYAGRIDHQVKIRGFRIELGEIEAQLHTLESVRDTAVIAQETANGKQLVAYIVPHDKNILPIESSVESESSSEGNSIQQRRQQWRADIKTALQSVLPDYMVPAHLVLLEQLPLTPNGKLDRKALPAVDASEAQQAYVAPQSELEQQLAAIWQSVLGLEQVGLNDNFFTLGGHSLLITQVISRVRKELQVEIPLRSLFEAAELGNFAKRVEHFLAVSVDAENTVDVIKPVSRDQQLPLSYAQQRQWVLWQLDPQSSAYHMSSALRLQGELDIRALEASFALLIKRHEVLRTHIAQDELGNPYQHIYNALDNNSKYFTLERESLPTTFTDGQLQQRLASYSQQPFDLHTGPLLKACLFTFATGDYVLALVQHHIISDAWSISRMVEELVTTYAALVAGTEPELPPFPIQYADYAVWQRERLSGAEGEKQLAYWKGQLGDEQPLLELPLDYPRPLQPSYRGRSQAIILGQALLAGIERQSRTQGVTRFMWLLAAFQTLLHRYSGQADIRVGSPIANRTRLETEHLLGFFVNTQVLRAQFEPDLSFEGLLTQVRTSVLEAQAHQDLPFEQLVEALQPERSLSHSPLFQVMFNYLVQTTQQGGVQQLPGLSVEGVEWEHSTAQFDLTLDVSEGDGKLYCRFNYATDLFDADTIARLVNHWQFVIEQLLAQPQKRLAQLPLLSVVEQQQILKDWNATDVHYGESQCIHSLIETQAKNAGDATAVTGPSLTQEASENTQQVSLSYSDLNEKANQLAHYLRAQGVGPDVLVGIAVERSVEMVIGLLAILKAGGAYVPLDPEYPADRLAYMIENSNINLLLTQSSLQNQLPICANVETVLLDELLSTSNQSIWNNYPTTNPANLTLPSNLAYVIYTSGSTGKPKGTLLPHRNVSRLFDATQHWFSFGSKDVWTMFHSYAFDFSVWEIFGALVYGGRLVIVPFMTSRSPDAFWKMLEEEKVTVLNQTPSAFRQLMQVAINEGQTGNEGQTTASALRYVIFGGEALELESLQPWFNRFGDSAPQLINMYGITETTVHVTYRPLTRDDKSGSPIGQVIPDLSWYVLDGELNPVIRGGQGELHVGQAGLARGYLKRGGLTAERFIPDPFAREPGGRLYRTGDLARYRADGVIEYAGRIDHQVKIRGFRIELGEIETQLHLLESIRDVAVLAVDIHNSKQLVAYLVPQDTSLVATEHTEARQQWRSDIKTALQSVLPDYMVPAHIVLLEQLPLTPNGKLDRKALPAVDASEAQQTYVAPQSEIEQQLAAIWQSVLGLEQIGLNDNFFELGGHSLLVTQVISRVRRELRLDIPLRSLFEAPVLGEFAKRVTELTSQSHGVGIVDVINPIARDQALPLSYAQQRQWVLWQLDPHSSAYHINTALRLKGELDVGALEQSFIRLAQRHEILRTHIGEDSQGKPVQIIDAEVAIHLERESLPAISDDQLQQRLSTYGQTPFDLTRGPLLRALLIDVSSNSPDQHQAGKGDYILALVQHHIISDAWSMGRMVEELVTTYAALVAGKEPELPTLPIQYADYAVWQRERLSGVEGEKQLAYWKQQLGDEQPLLELPLDHPRPLQPSYQGRSHAIILDQTLLAGIERQSRTQGVTRFMWLLAAFQTLLHRYSGQSDIRVGSPIANRTRLETEHLLGFFVNTQVLRAQFEPDLSFEGLLTQVRTSVLEAQAHQDLPFEQLVEALQPERSLSHSPLFQVMFNYLVQTTQQGGVQQLPGLSVEGVEWEHSTAQFDLTLDVSEGDGKLYCRFNYATDLFDADTIARLVNHWQFVIEQLLAQPQKRLAQLPLLSVVEQQQILKDWNATDVHYGESQCIHSLIEAQVEQSATAIAVTGLSLQSASSSDIEQQISLSYSDLNTKANQLAHYLRANGVGPDVLVGIAVERSVEMVIGLLAILKAGGAYVPLDPEYPSERIAYMIENSNINLLLTQSSLKNQLPIPTQVETVLLDELLSTSHQSLWKNYPTTNPANLTLPSNLAYVIYTSGSTGKPKGTLLPHRNVSRLFDATQHWFSFGSKDVWTMFHSYAFDFSVWEIFGALVYGGRLVIVPFMTSRSPDAFWKMLEEEKVTVLNQTPSAFRQLMQVAINEGQTGNEGQTTASALRYVIFGGEALELESLQPWFNRFGDSAPQLINMYGITETTVHVTYRPLTRDDKSGSPIGQVIPDLSWYVLDGELNPVIRGGQGELHVGQAGLARGYLKRGGLTAERFIPDPFAREPGGRLYRTGDLARYRADGVIEYAGRIDHQVKIRGFRIELGEIETQLHLLESIRDVAVLAVDIHNSKQLVAYLVPQDTSLVATEHTEARQQWRSDIKTALQSVLPDYMVPAHIVLLEQLPLTPNGKLDRKALPAVDMGDAQQTYVAPQSEIEQQLAAIWQSVLGIEQIGLNDNFFALGGDSIIALQLVSRARQAGIHFTPKDVFQHQTLAALGMAASLVTSESVATQDPVTGSCPLTPIQTSFFSKSIPQQHHWNQSVLLRPLQVLDANYLEKALQQLMAQHDALRLCFSKSVEGEWQGHFASVEDAAGMKLLWQVSVVDDADMGVHANLAQSSLDLEKGPLLRAVLFTLPTGEQRLLLAIHHLVVDGVSWRILLEDLQQAYEQLQQGKKTSLPPKTTSFKAWGEHLEEYAHSSALLAEMDYWQSLADVTSEPPRDNPAGLQQSRYIGVVSTRLDKPLTQHLLKDAPAAYRTQINDLLLTALARVICRWTGEPSTLITLEGHGREDLFDGIDLSRTVGWFTSVFPVKLTPANSLESSIKTIKEQLRQIPAKGVGYGLLRYLGNDSSRQFCTSLPEARITFNYLGQFDGSFSEDQGGLFVPISGNGGASQSADAPLDNWLSINGQVYNGALELNWSFSTDVYRSETIQRLAFDLEHELQELISHCLSSGAGGMTPSDLIGLDMAQHELDQLLDEIL